MTREKQDILFAGLPRRRRLAGFVTVAVWLGIGVAFLTDVVPTRSSADWLYGVEARRDAHARALAARAAAQPLPVARRAARAAPKAPPQAPDSRIVEVVRPASLEPCGSAPPDASQARVGHP